MLHVTNGQAGTQLNGIKKKHRATKQMEARHLELVELNTIPKLHSTESLRGRSLYHRHTDTARRRLQLHV